MLATTPRPQLGGPHVAYLLIAEKPATPTVPPTPVPTSTPAPMARPAPPPPTYNNCAADPDPGTAPAYLVRLTQLDRVQEFVILTNTSTAPVNLGNWRICSVTGNQLHASIPDTITINPGQELTIDRQAATAIWNNLTQDDAMLYDANGSLVSYWVDQ